MKKYGKYVIILLVLLVIAGGAYFLMRPSDEEIQAELLDIVDSKANYILLGSETDFDDYSDSELLYYYFMTQGHVDAKIEATEDGVLTDFVEVDANVVEDYILETFDEVVNHRNITIDYCVDYDFENMEGTYEEVVLYEYNKSSHTYIAQELAPECFRLNGFTPNAYGQEGDILNSTPVVTELIDYKKIDDDYIITVINGYNISLAAYVLNSSYIEYDGEIIAEEDSYILDGQLVEIDNSVEDFLSEYSKYNETSEELEKTIYNDMLKFYHDEIDEEYRGLYKHQFTFEKENGNYILKSYEQFK